MLTLVSAVGLVMGKLRIGKLSLGITFVFFVGILAAHFGVKVNVEMNSFAQTLGLTLFVYALGVEVGPSFFPSLKKQGLLYNALGLMLIVTGLLLVVILHYTCGVSMPNMLGIMSGAVTNTPMLAAVQSTLQDILGASGTREVADLALACALTYPLGVVGVILAIMVLHYIDPNRGKSPHELEAKTTYITELELTNPALFGKTVLETVGLIKKKFIISRIWRGEALIIPSSHTVLEAGDHLLILIHKDDLRLEIQGYPIKKYGSQGQQKSLLIALKLSQFELLKRALGITPIVLLDDIFDKLDDTRVAQLVQLVTQNHFGQLFITDTHSQRTEEVVKMTGLPYQMILF